MTTRAAPHNKEKGHPKDALNLIWKVLSCFAELSI
jgi:hypothetical protein